jgi:hypothetical protein
MKPIRPVPKTMNFSPNEGLANRIPCSPMLAGTLNAACSSETLSLDRSAVAEPVAFACHATAFSIRTPRARE